jgi:hypothetical protein
VCAQIKSRNGKKKTLNVMECGHIPIIGFKDQEAQWNVGLVWELKTRMYEARWSISTTKNRNQKP